MYIFIAGILAYLLGSFPSAVALGKWLKGIDVRGFGSGNAGATNVFRVLGWQLGVPVLMLDIAKGIFAARLSFLDVLSNHGLDRIEMALVFGLAAVIGHLFPIFAGFKGGKGVATFFGVLIGAHPESAFVSVAIFTAVFFLTKYVSLASIITSIMYPVQIIVVHNFQQDLMIVFSLIVPLVVCITHSKNINRLLNGTENRVNFSKSN
ncbi:MAG: glycerol-3-phosphate 1-O-acyltransferase PlsY [Bacteroidetes bacterium]|nr:glycerol-3-phosphate 1-O-acyltransferase PlsY [Bacteroidota bacterium]